jgi:hypothetical protein
MARRHQLVADQRRAGVPHRPIHALRHHAIGRMIEAGFSPKEVQVAAGHASITTTFDRYGHVMPGTLAGQRERLAALDARGGRGTAPTRERARSTGPFASSPAELRAHAGSTDAPERIAPAPSRRKPRLCGAFAGAPERT